MKEKVLWLTVIHMACLDFRSGNLGWYYFRSKSFKQICQMADVDPENVRKTIRPTIDKRMAASA